VAEYTAAISWERGDSIFVDNRYSRAHTWKFDGGLTVNASASPRIVPLPFSIAENVDPEEAFIASLSSCHMLFFLSIAADKGIVVDSYQDSAVGYLERGTDGGLAMTRVVLRPKAIYAVDTMPTALQIEAIHHEAHERCFIANSVRTDVMTEIIS
jgi:organic hydroperoxide reductase OsmC/OhrA